MKNTSKLIHSVDHHIESQCKPVKTVNPPLFTGSTVLFDSYEDLMLANSGKYDGITYGTDRLPTQRAFEEALNDFENGHLTRAFQSGISAITNTLLAFHRQWGSYPGVSERIWPHGKFLQKDSDQIQYQNHFCPAGCRG